MAGLAGGSGRGGEDWTGRCLCLWPAPSSRSDSEPPRGNRLRKPSRGRSVRPTPRKLGIRLTRVLAAMFHDRRQKSRRSTELVQEEVVVQQSAIAVSHNGQVLEVFEQPGSTYQLGT